MPDWTLHLRPRLARLNLRGEREAEIVEELSQHLDERYQELLGLSASISVDNPKTHEKTTGYAQDNFSADNSDDPQGFAQVRPRPQDNFSAPSG